MVVAGKIFRFTGPVPGDWRFRNFITTIKNFAIIGE